MKEVTYMANEKVVLRRGPHDSIPETKVPGTILVETDTGNVFVDDSTEERIQLKDSTKVLLDDYITDDEIDEICNNTNLNANEVKY